MQFSGKQVFFLCLTKEKTVLRTFCLVFFFLKEAIS